MDQGFSILLAIWVAIDFILDVLTAKWHADLGRMEEVPMLSTIATLQSLSLFVTCVANFGNLFKIIFDRVDFYYLHLQQRPTLWAVCGLLSLTNLEQLNLFLKLTTDANTEEAKNQISIVKGRTFWSNVTEDLPQIVLQTFAIAIMLAFDIEVPFVTMVSVFFSFAVLVLVLLEHVLVLTINRKDSQSTAWLKKNVQVPNLFAEKGRNVMAVWFTSFILFVINGWYSTMDSFGDEHSPAFASTLAVQHLINFFILIAFLLMERRGNLDHILHNPSCHAPVMIWSVVHPSCVQFFFSEGPHQTEGTITTLSRTFSLRVMVLSALMAVVNSVFHFLAGRPGVAILSLFSAFHQLFLYKLVVRTDEWKSSGTFAPVWCRDDKCKERATALARLLLLQAINIVFFISTAYFIFSAPLKGFNMALAACFFITLIVQVTGGLYLQMSVQGSYDPWKVGNEFGMTNTIFVVLYCIHPLSAWNAAMSAAFEPYKPQLPTIILGQCVTALAVFVAAWSAVVGSYGMCVFACFLVLHTVVLGVINMARMQGTHQEQMHWNPQCRRLFEAILLLCSAIVLAVNVVFVVGCGKCSSNLFFIGTLCLVLDALVNFSVFLMEIMQQANTISNFSPDVKCLLFFNVGATIVAMMSVIHLPNRIFLGFSDDWCKQVHLGKNRRALIVNTLMHLFMAAAQLYMIQIHNHQYLVPRGWLIVFVTLNMIWCVVHSGVYLLVGAIHEARAARLSSSAGSSTTVPPSTIGSAITVPPSAITVPPSI